MNLAVIIPCYNSAAWVAATVESVLAQTVPPAEVLVVNDGSTDSSAQVLCQFRGRIRVIDQQNKGLAGARNSGAREAKSDWLAFLDADDVYEPDFIRSITKLHATFSEAEMLFTDHSSFDSTGTVLESSFRHFVPDLVSRAEQAQGDMLLFGRRLMDVLIERNGAFAPSTLVVHRRLLDQVGGFYEPMRGAEDLEFYARAGPQTKTAIANIPLMCRRQHPTSLGRDYKTMRPTVEQFYHRASELYSQEHPELLPLIRRKYSGLLLSAGIKERRLKMYAAARRTFLQLVRHHPSHLRAWYLLADVAVRGLFNQSEAAMPLWPRPPEGDPG